MPKNDFAEYCYHNIVLEFGYSEHEEMSLESWRDVFAATTGRSHGTHQLNFDQFYRDNVLPIVPIKALGSQMIAR